MFLIISGDDEYEGGFRFVITHTIPFMFYYLLLYGWAIQLLKRNIPICASCTEGEFQ